MKANELSCKDLMIGDWVYNTHNQQNERVQEIGSSLDPLYTLWEQLSEIMEE